MDSIHLLWGQAWTYQREMKEWYGIDFPGSPRVDEEFVLEGWEGPPMMRRDFDSLAYSDATYTERPGRETHDPADAHERETLPGGRRMKREDHARRSARGAARRPTWIPASTW